ncbi:deoxyribonuclease-2-alpha isoform X2 [Oreochromis aureus]|uniref:deoxyribonuclease-2-alpha isoform X2 n=1 Tax=Oreochromis aureus TaxID=47969 RepID=UPI0012BC6230|nr:deoxyribonuclease-2-alpha isoform X2 [Oreochromis aureus]
MLLFLSVLILYVPLEGNTSPISCYNDQGDAVDWFYIYKLPKEHGSKSPEQGEMYLLLDQGSEGWTEGKGTVNDTTSALGRTVGQLYTQGKNTDIAYILYNDQKPHEDSSGDRWVDNSESRGGHTKGVVLLDKNQGFWLVHSTPQFPPVQQAGEYYYPSSGEINGQNFICVTYPLDHFQTIDLYHAWVAPTLQSDLLVQFWIRSPGILPSNCSEDWKVLNIKLLNPGQTFSFKTSQDHSKWAVSPSETGAGGGWVCVGDINRDEAEEKRGGGTVCHRDPVVWKAYRTAALDCEDCQGKTVQC